MYECRLMKASKSGRFAPPKNKPANVKGGVHKYNLHSTFNRDAIMLFEPQKTTMFVEVLHLFPHLIRRGVLLRGQAPPSRSRGLVDFFSSRRSRFVHVQHKSVPDRSELWRRLYISKVASASLETRSK